MTQDHVYKICVYFTLFLVYLALKSRITNVAIIRRKPPKQKNSEVQGYKVRSKGEIARSAAI